MSTKTISSLPKEPSEWNQALVRYPQTSSIHGLQSARSASDITAEQFLSLKVLWPKRRTVTDLSADNTSKLYGSSNVELQALKAETRKNEPSWKAYLKAIEASKPTEPTESKVSGTMKLPRDLGVYALVLQAQLEAAGIPNSTD